MYTPPAYAENDTAQLHAFMRAHSFATLVTQGRDGLNATHLPFLLDDGAGPHGLLTTHLARANPQLRDLREGAPVLVLFQGPHAFVSPSWYANQATFPTWNYTAVHARGRATLLEQPQDVHAVLRATVACYDQPLGGSWDFAASPAALVAPRLRAIVALHIPIAQLEGKMKLSQDKSVADRRGVVAALQASAVPESLAVARLIRAQPDMAAAFEEAA
jgi:transcriptional regulator